MRAMASRPGARLSTLRWAVSAEPDSGHSESHGGPRGTRVAPPVPSATDGSAQHNGRRRGALRPWGGRARGSPAPPRVPWALGRPHRPHPSPPDREPQAPSLLTTLVSAFDGGGNEGTWPAADRDRPIRGAAGQPWRPLRLSCLCPPPAVGPGSSRCPLSRAAPPWLPPLVPCHASHRSPARRGGCSSPRCTSSCPHLCSPGTTLDSQRPLPRLLLSLRPSPTGLSCPAHPRVHPTGDNGSF